MKEDLTQELEGKKELVEYYGQIVEACIKEARRIHKSFVPPDQIPQVEDRIVVNISKVAETLFDAVLKSEAVAVYKGFADWFIGKEKKLEKEAEEARERFMSSIPPVPPPGASGFYPTLKPLSLHDVSMGMLRSVLNNMMNLVEAALRGEDDQGGQADAGQHPEQATAKGGA